MSKQTNKAETKKVYSEFTMPSDGVVNVYLGGKHLKGNNYVRAFCSALRVIARDKRLKGEDRRVLIEILSCMQYENGFTTPVSELARNLEINQTNADRSVKRLVELRYILPVEKRKGIVIYMINPDIAFKSKAFKLEGLKEFWKQLEMSQSIKENSLAL